MNAAALRSRFTLETPLREFFEATRASSRLHQVYAGHYSHQPAQVRPQTIGELCRCCASELKQYNLGKKSFRELEDLLIAHGFYLADSASREERVPSPTTKLKGTSLSTRAILAAHRLLGVRSVGDLANVVRAGRPPSFADDAIWEEIVAKLRFYHLLDGDVPGLSGVDAPMVALTRSLLERWSESEATVLADWCEEHSLAGAAYHLRHAPTAATRAVVESLGCCFGLRMVVVRSDWSRWAREGVASSSASGGTPDEGGEPELPELLRDVRIRENRAREASQQAECAAAGLSPAEMFVSKMNNVLGTSERDRGGGDS